MLVLLRGIAKKGIFNGKKRYILTGFEKYLKDYFDRKEALAYRSKIIQRTENLFERNALLEEYYPLWVRFISDFEKIHRNSTVPVECKRRYGEKCVRGPDIIEMWERYFKEKYVAVPKLKR
jgi:hypothetical protein